tara:strand:+ start:878 stop:1081 length:204 start_codon:yes stop_codon:yes gene_type:complete
MKRSKNISTAPNNFGLMFGYILVGIAMLDFVLSYAGINLTSFLGAFSRYSPLVIGGLGYLLISGNSK